MELDLVPLLMRWVHIVAACIALGGPFFVRFALIPAMTAGLPPETAGALKERYHAIWRHVVYLTILAFLISGLYNFFTVILGWGGRGAWPLGDDKALYHGVFGFKMILALWAFFLASALAGRTKALAFIRANARMWLMVLLVTLLVIVMFSNTLRAIRDANPKLPTPRLPLGT